MSGIQKPRSLPGITLVCLLACFGEARGQSMSHTGPITRVAVDPANRVLVTASEDKSVRIWELSSGRWVRTIEVPSGPGEHGKVYALAVSPDGRHVAFAGYTGQKNRRDVEGRTHFDYEIYIHELTSGRRVRTLDVPGIIDGLAWSTSGDFLVATTSDMPPSIYEDVQVPLEALHIFKAPEYTPVVGPTIARPRAAVAGYDREGRLIAVYKPGGSFVAELFGVNFEPVDSRQFDGNPGGIAISPDGSMFALATLYSGLLVHSTGDLSVLHEQEFRSQTVGALTLRPEHSAVAWSADGRWLYFAGRATCTGDGCAVRAWRADQWASYTDIPVSTDRVTHLVALEGGGFAFGTAGASFGVVDATHRRTLYIEPPPAAPQAPASETRAAPRDEFWSACIIPPGLPLLPDGRFPHQRGKFLFIDKAGRAVMAPPFDSVLPFSEGRARVSLDGKYGYLDRAGRLVIPVQFENAREFYGSRAAVEVEGLMAFIDLTGKVVIPPRFVRAGNFSGGLASVKEYGQDHHGYINVRGEMVIPPTFDQADDFHDGKAAVRVRDKWGFINTRGEWIDALGSDAARNSAAERWRAEMAPSFAEGLKAFLQGGLWGYLDEAGHVAIPPRFNEVSPFSEGLASVCVAAENVTSVPVAPGPPPDVQKTASVSSDVVIPPSPRPALSESDRQRLDALHETVLALAGERRYIEALARAREAVTIAEQALWRDDPGLIQPWFDLARVRQMLGNYRAVAAGRISETLSAWRDARDGFSRALQLVEGSRGAYHADVAPIANELSDVFASLGEYDLAVDMKRRVIAIAKAAGDAESAAGVKAKADIAALRAEELVFPDPKYKDLMKALPASLAQLRAAETASDAADVNVARAAYTVAAIYSASKVGVRGAAIKLYERALAAYSANGSEDRQRALAASVAIARLYVEARRFSDAERLFGQVTSEVEVVLGQNDPALIELWTERGYALRASGQHAAAAAVFARVLSVWEDRLRLDGSASFDVRAALERLADTRRVMGDYTTAEQLYLRILDSEPGLPWMHQSRVLKKIGASQRLRGDLVSARASLEKALDILKPQLGLRPRTMTLADFITAEVVAELCALAAAANDPGRLRECMRFSATLDDHNFWVSQTSDRLLEQVQDSSRMQAYYQTLLFTARHLRGDSDWVRQAYDLVLDRKGIVLDLQLQTRPAAGNVDATARRQLEELAVVRSELAAVMMRRTGSRVSAEDDAAVTSLFERAKSLEEDSVSTVVRLEAAERRPRITSSDIKANLPRDATLVEFVRVRDEDPAEGDIDAPHDDDAVYLAFVVTPGGELSVVELGSARTLDVLAGDGQAAMRIRADSISTGRVLKELHARLWTPLEPLLGSSRHIILSPDGELHRVPFAALIDTDGRFLIERFRFAYSGSGRDLALSPLRREGIATLDLALLADADFGSPGPYAPLPATVVEAERIPRLVPRGKPHTILRARDATEAAVKGLPPARILHIATHGFFLAADDFRLEAAEHEQALVRSGLALAGANGSNRLAGGDDGLLTALEVSSLNLTATELVVLSSCDSGAGSIVNGEGVFGLRRAFRMAGASSILMALWPVEDRLTAEMMIDFYRNAATMPSAAALHEAQLEAVRRNRARQGFAAAFDWAAFILESPTAFGQAAARR
jgi:CHAT domain-containing protein/tetratricopeptide (TPR) repeat protein